MSPVVVFYDGGVEIGRVAKDSISPDGSYSLQTATLGAGRHDIRVAFLGSQGYARQHGGTWTIPARLSIYGASFSASTVAIVAPAPLTVEADDGSRGYGTPGVGYAASFSGLVNGEGPSVLAGTLTVTDATPIDASPGVYPAALVPSGLSSPNYAITYAPGALTVEPTEATTTTLTSSSSAPSYGQHLTFTALVSAASRPSGWVQFSVDGVDVGAATAVDSEGKARFATAGLAPGSHVVAARFRGAAGQGDSSATAAVAVGLAAPSVSLRAPGVEAGLDAVVTVTVAAAGLAPSGGVTLRSRGGVALFEPLVGGSATFRLSGLPAGVHELVAEYAGADGIAAASARGSARVFSLDGAPGLWPAAAYMDRGADGLWGWSPGAGLARIDERDPESFVVAPDGTLYVDFGPRGLWSWSGSEIARIDALDPEGMLAAPDGSLIVDGGESGLWRRDATGFVKLNSANPEGFAAAAGVVYVDYGRYGLWSLVGSTFSLINPSNPEGMAAAPDGTLYVDFGPYGFWRRAGSGMVRINPSNPEALAVAADGSVFVDFGPYGLWRWSGREGLVLLNAANPQALAATRDGSVFVDFGPFGLWSWKDSSFAKIHESDADGLYVGGDGALFVDFGPLGVWRRDRSASLRRIY